MFKPTIINFAVAGSRYSIELYEFRFKLYSLRPNVEIVPTAAIADFAIAACRNMSGKDKRKYQGALEALVAVLCPTGGWLDIAKKKQECGLSCS
jgi:hypothetical protein